jgi:hypothetical protein
MYLGPFVERARSYADALRRSLDQQTAQNRRIVLDGNCPPPDVFVGERPRFAVELSFVNLGSRLDCALTVKHFATGELIRVFRLTVAQGDAAALRPGPKATESTAAEIMTAIWDALTYPDGTPRDTVGRAAGRSHA